LRFFTSHQCSKTCYYPLFLTSSPSHELLVDVIRFLSKTERYLKPYPHIFIVVGMWDWSSKHLPKLDASKKHMLWGICPLAWHNTSISKSTLAL
jgi:hypothetical protein